MKKMVPLSIAYIFIYCVPLILGEATTTISCGTKRVKAGQSHFLRCNIQGEITHGIKWYHGDDSQPIVSCDEYRNCTSSNITLYRVSPHHDPKGLTLGITSATQEDIDKSWTCVDSPANKTRLEEIPETSTCKIKGAIVPADLGCGLIVGMGVLINCGVAGGGVLGLICGLEPPLPVSVIVGILAGITVVSLGAGSWYACKAMLSTTEIGAISLGVWAFIILLIFTIVYLGKKIC